MDIYSGAILASLIIYIAVGNYAGRRVKKLDDYFVAGRRAPTLLIVGTLVASVLSTNAFLGETGFVYEGQAGPYLLWPPIAAMGYIFGALLFGRYLRRSRALTVADYFGKRFNSHRVQVAAGITIIFGLGGYLLAVTQGTAFHVCWKPRCDPDRYTDVPVIHISGHAVLDFPGTGCRWLGDGRASAGDVAGEA